MTSSNNVKSFPEKPAPLKPALTPAHPPARSYRKYTGAVWSIGECLSCFRVRVRLRRNSAIVFLGFLERIRGLVPSLDTDPLLCIDETFSKFRQPQRAPPLRLSADLCRSAKHTRPRSPYGGLSPQRPGAFLVGFPYSQKYGWDRFRPASCPDHGA